MKRPSTRSRASASWSAAVLLAALRLHRRVLPPSRPPGHRRRPRPRRADRRRPPRRPCRCGSWSPTSRGRLGDRRPAAVVARGPRGARGVPRRGVPAGDYPRSDFGDSFGSFTARRGPPGPAATVRCSPTAGSVPRPTPCAPPGARRTSRCSRPEARCPASPPRSTWCFVVDRGERPAQRVHLTGRLLLTRTGTGPWRIFGYDLAPLRRSPEGLLMTATDLAAPPVARAAPRPGARAAARGHRRSWCPPPRCGTATPPWCEVHTAQAVDHPRTWSGSSASARTPARASG